MREVFVASDLLWTRRTRAEFHFVSAVMISWVLWALKIASEPGRWPASSCGMRYGCSVVDVMAAAMSDLSKIWNWGADYPKFV